ncbi:MAG: M15 family metallopeptidase [Terriglobales bacterium]
MTNNADIGGSVPVVTNFQPPKGIDQIIATFGNIHDYIQTDGTLDVQWPINYLDYVALPVPLMLSFDHSKTITHFRCHKLLVETLEAVFLEIRNEGMEPELFSFGGCFSFRPQRNGSKLSAHSWGIAIDLNSESNAQGTAGNMHPGIVSVFRAAGFEWGGDWPGRSKDPMHFQFCTGY